LPEILAFPNPTREVLEIVNFNPSGKEIALLGLDGKTHFLPFLRKENKISVNLSNLNSGTYHLVGAASPIRNLKEK
jgi:hypothetical protein